MKIREKIYYLLESSNDSFLSKFYNVFMIFVIILSLIPLAFKTNHLIFDVVDKFCVVVFIADYLLRFLTADFKYKKKSILSFIRYPFSIMALIDLISILPSLTVVNNGFKVLRTLRMLRSIRIIRVFKAARYSKNIRIISKVLKKSKESLVAVGIFAIAYIFISALIIINVEPNSFNSFFDAIYWATVSLTTVGYGDIYPVTTVGRLVTMVSSIFGIAVVALPSGIITAGYLKEIDDNNDN